MRLVDHQHLMLGQHRGITRHRHAQHRMVGDHHIRGRGLTACQLREAFLAQRTLGAHAFGLSHRDLCPGAVADPRNQIVPIAGVGLCGPLTQTHHLLPQRGLRALTDFLLRGFTRRKQAVGFLVAGVAAFQFVFADVVLPALQQRHAGTRAGGLFDGVGRQRRILGDNLPLQRQGGGGDDRPFPRCHRMCHCGH